MRAIAVDWSGKKTRPEEFIWLAEASDGLLTDLRNGFSRKGLVCELLRRRDADPRMVVGLDFAFSFPEWWCEEQGWRSVRDAWRAMRDDGDRLLRESPDPLWGRAKANPNPPERRYRDTDKGAKSVFQIGGAGAVGTGSIRGMPCLLKLSEAGFGVWPFDPPGAPRVVEIYPRALTEPALRKSRWSERHAHPSLRGQKRHLRERAAGSEDAFDAAVSAIVMSRHAEEIAALAPADDPRLAIEGCIWRPANGDR